jgi:CRISPR-associated protein Cas1
MSASLGLLLTQLKAGFKSNNLTIWNRDMATIYLIEQGATVHKDYQQFVIRISENNEIEVPIREVERILVFGNIQLTTPVINACLKQNILVLFLSQSGKYNGHLWGLTASHLNHELIQLQRQDDREFQLNVSSSIVWGKLMNSKRLLIRLNRKRQVAEVEQAILGIHSDIDAIASVDNIDSLRGYEGSGAARYFPAWGQLITNQSFSFSHRFRHPPTDPVNSLLSFGYTILFNNVLSLIIAEGLSPYFGNFHYGERDKPYLAFDLMEEFRSPIVDSLVLKVLNKSLLKLEDFAGTDGKPAIYLSETGRRVFLKHLEMRLNEEVSHPDIQTAIPYRQVIQLQIRRYKRSLIASVPYEPFVRDI